jgi:hypothetical protein
VTELPTLNQFYSKEALSIQDQDSVVDKSVTPEASHINTKMKDLRKKINTNYHLSKVINHRLNQYNTNSISSIEDNTINSPSHTVEKNSPALTLENDSNHSQDAKDFLL